MGPKGIFITGTDTQVGKTFVACALASAYRAAGKKVGVMKPVETGCKGSNGELIPADALMLKDASGFDAPLDLINPYRFKEPLAPSVASRLEGITIDLKKIKKCYNEIATQADVVIVEGAGGILVPLNEDATMADLIKYLGLPIIIVSSSRLGCINHTLLTIRHAESMDIKVNGVVLNHPDGLLDDSRMHNCQELRSRGVRIIGEMPNIIDKDHPEEKAAKIFTQASL
ncbi:MAG: dethiobiotin synthase [Deltaproteobacteria bacterium]|nr:dethiobiotin synthase [Deltaproteobacteria bacterium]